MIFNVYYISIFSYGGINEAAASAAAFSQINAASSVAHSA